MRDERKGRGRMEGGQKECHGNGGRSFVNCMCMSKGGNVQAD